MSTVVENQRRARTRRRWRFPWAAAIACLVILAGTGIFLYPHIASWFSQKEQSRVTALAQERLLEPPQDDEIYRMEQFELAHEYNNALASGAVYRANTNVATGDGTTTDESLVYEDIINFSDAGFMGRLRYEALDIDLPIYHGTSVKTLEIGVGHLEGTSLPVGGIGTRPALTAHRGLPSSTLFNELDKAQIGDTFSVSVLDQVFAYEVVDIREVEPSQTEAIFADPKRDLVTLVTCTPLGINSHRILVTGERIEPTPAEEIAAAAEAPELPRFPWWAVILGGVVTVCGVYVWRSGYENVVTQPKQAAHRATARV
ncbi:MAG TPA: class C sortase [Actinomycetaceae bacterium]|nr:class C sortase [Actinomycetaceae bacterium]